MLLAVAVAITKGGFFIEEATLWLVQIQDEHGDMTEQVLLEKNRVEGEVSLLTDKITSLKQHIQDEMRIRILYEVQDICVLMIIYIV